MASNLSTQPYKGARDFYPEDMRLQNYLFNTWRKVAARYGYSEIAGPMIELTELYRAKSGEELVNEQIYNFIDRGGRDVTIRPEMTPTVARMVAAQRMEMAYPVRWYSLPNLWRYERPQKGRLREHWQMNVDLIGVEGVYADAEIIMVADSIMKQFDATSDMYKIRINHRQLINRILGDHLELDVADAHKVTKLLDRKDKIEPESFRNQLEVIVGDNTEKLLAIVNAKNMGDLPEELKDAPSVKHIAKLFGILKNNGIDNAVFDLSLMRGLDYYTGVVFEMFDTDPENNRALFGGGRYDHLVEIFGVEPLPAVGFGMGDVMIGHFLEAHDLTPGFGSPVEAYILMLGEVHDAAFDLANKLRAEGVDVGVDFTDRKVQQQLKHALKQNIQHAIFVGEKEVETGVYTLKDLSSETESQLTLEELIEFFKG